MTNKMKILTHVVAPVAVVICALACAGAMVFLSPEADRSIPPATSTVVSTLLVATQPIPTEIRATGTTEPTQTITVIPQISGKVIATHPNLVPGGRILAGEVIVHIDPRDYALALEQERARVEGAEVEFLLEGGRAKIAKEEWELMGSSLPSSEAPLAIRQPQLQVAAMNLDAARASRDRANLQLERTVIRAPFDAVVRSENVDVGQVVGPGTVVASLMGTRALYVRCSVPAKQLARIQTRTADTEGSAATVTQRFGDGSQVSHEGYARETFGELDPQTRRASVLIEIPEPLASSVPLLAGAFVDVTLQGPVEQQAFQIPQSALHDGNYVWLNQEGTLTKRNVTVGWRNDRTITVVGGLQNGERVVTSPLALPIEGMWVEDEDTLEETDAN